MSNEIPFPGGAKERVDFEIAPVVEDVKLYKVEPYKSQKGLTGIAFFYLKSDDNTISFLKDIRWAPRTEEENKALSRALESIACCFMDKGTFYQGIESPKDFEEYAQMYATLLTENLKNNRSLDIKVVPNKYNNKWYPNLGKFPPFIRGRGEDIDLSYTEWEQKRYNEWVADNDEAIVVSSDNEPDYDDLPF